MNENPEGTPNPLNPNPGTTPQAPTPATQPVSPNLQPITANPVPPQPVVGETISTAPEVQASPNVENTTPLPAEKKPKKAGLIVAIILFVVAIIAGVAAAIIMLDPFGFRKDAVPSAISKLFSGDAPENVAMSGVISLASEEETSPVSSLVIDFQSGIKSADLENYVNASITATFKDQTEFTFDTSEVRLANGDLYLKLSNIAEALNNYKASTSVETNCVEDPSGETNCAEIVEDVVVDCVEGDGACDPNMPTAESSVLDFLGVFEAIDDEWIRIPGSSFGTLTDVADVDDTTQCLIDAAGKLSEYGSDFATIYQSNPFITYSTENIKIAQKKSQLYRLGFDTDKLAGFMNKMGNSGFANELFACTGDAATNVEVDATELQEIVDSLPTIYVEIDGEYNFTRAYLDLTTPDEMMRVTADLSFSYPTSITVKEPEVYLDINEVLSKLFTMFYGQEDTNFTVD